MSEFSFPKYNGFSVQLDELVAENTIAMRKATYEAISSPAALPEPVDSDSPATEIHEDDELSINNAEPESVDKQ
jgi:hypothetical protein